MEETFDFTDATVGIVGINIENFGRTNVVETLNPKLEILKNPKPKIQMFKTSILD